MTKVKLDLLIYAQYGRYVGRGVMIKEDQYEYPYYGILTDINTYSDDEWLFEINGECIYAPAYLEGVSKNG